MKKSLICPLPWLSLAVRNDGVHRVCCHANVSEGRGVLRDSQNQVQRADEQPIAEVRNSESLKEIRRQMLKGEWPAACGRCHREESLGLRSKRIYASEFLDLPFQKYQDGTAQDGSIPISEWPIEDLDLRFGNKCNLKCRMCGPSDSNAWYGDFEALQGRAFQPEGNFSWYQDERFWEQLFQQTEKLQHIYLVGGEPLLIKQHFSFLRRLADTGRASQVTLEYNSNLTVLPDEVLEIWRSFKEVKVGVSVDGYGELNNYIRHPSVFKNIENNLLKLDAAPIHLNAWIATTLSIYNFLDLNELLIWKVRMNFSRVGVSKEKPLITPHFLHKPSHLSLKCLPAAIKNRTKELMPRLRQDFEHRLAEFSLPGPLVSNYLRQWDDIHSSILKFMEAEASGSDDFARFKTWNQDLDKIRSQTFQSVMSPQYQAAFEGHL
ncbi:twitch domain-containing radical SAM protein [Bdellovibrio sp. HCB2-146]|uniref:twitch domain-containing radical SAM protein n=1 Tax=Bdellovibrio sp. HCB2-146 TaxID=3394362 RepID=UPI0039BCDC89